MLISSLLVGSYPKTILPASASGLSRTSRKKPLANPQSQRRPPRCRVAGRLLSLARPWLLIYTYMAWVATHKVSLREGLPVAALVYLAAVALAYGCLKFYDEPVRGWLRKRVL